MKISVIIPFFGSQIQGLMRCLGALREQIGVAELEVIVVDNNSHPLSRELEKLSDVIVVHEKKIGSYAARNRGVQCASGDLLAFTDADCIPSSSWLAEGAKALSETPEPCAIAGDIRVVPRSVEKPCLAEHLDAAIHHRQEDYVVRLGFGATANLVVSKQTFLEVGGFNERLLSGGDQEWCDRLSSIGGIVEFRREAHVDHPARRSFVELAIKNARGVGGQFSRMPTNQSRLMPLLRTQAFQFANRRKFLVHYCQGNDLAIWKSTYLEVMLAAIYAVKIGEVIRLCIGGSPVRR